MIKIIKNILRSLYVSLKVNYLRLKKAKVANNTVSINENGFLYIVTGKSYVDESILSILSVKKFQQEKICVFSEEKYREKFIGICDFFFPIDTKIKRPKIEYISQSPFHKTIYLDSDTILVRPVTELFNLLDRFEFSGSFCNSRKRKNYSLAIKKYAQIPYSFSEINTGVLAFKKTERVDQLFENWNKYYYKYLRQSNGWDQPSFRIALWESTVALCHLPPEYNVRPRSVFEKVRKNKSILGEDHMEPRIYHAHYSSEVHKGKFTPQTLLELETILKENLNEITH